MRNIKVAAIQPAHISVPAPYSPLSPDYRNVPAEIVEHYVKPQLAVTTRLLEQAGEAGCGIATSCEDSSVLADFGLDITERGVFPQIVDLAQPVMEAAFSEIARKYSMYVIGCYLAKRAGKIYNTAAIFDRAGRIAGEYHKAHLPANETWQIAPGDSLDVFDLDFGRVGICICYDMMFPETTRVLALKGAEVIFHPTFGYGWYDSIGEAALRTRANDNGVYIVTSSGYRHMGAGGSGVVDPWGQLLVNAGFGRDVIVTKEIDLDEKKEQPDWYFNAPLTGRTDVRARLFAERRPELYGLISEKQADRYQVPEQAEKLGMLEDIRSGKTHW